MICLVNPGCPDFVYRENTTNPSLQKTVQRSNRFFESRSQPPKAAVIPFFLCHKPEVYVDNWLIICFSSVFSEERKSISNDSGFPYIQSTVSTILSLTILSSECSAISVKLFHIKS